MSRAALPSQRQLWLSLNDGVAGWRPHRGLSDGLMSMETPSPVGDLEAMHRSVTPNTVRAVRSDWGIFTRWCAERGEAALPAAAETVAAFVDAMATQRATATVRRYVSSIAHVHRSNEVENAVWAEPVRQALRRMHCKYG